VLRSVIGRVFNHSINVWLVGFRIYRETLSRFSCAASAGSEKSFSISSRGFSVATMCVRKNSFRF
ncbi:hypothetical protein, partial [Photobacterium leiognathi]|uniref:hypothetical protein n=1 Tax=Photobacterium leiognathi TaxID=553611 RepID=UPI003F754A76